MYFWDAKALAQALSADKLHKRDYKNYYLLEALMVSGIYYYGMFSPYYSVSVISFEAILTFLIMMIGIQRAYVANGGDQGQHFLNRITALSFPIMLQTMLAGIIFAFILFGIYQSLHLEHTAFDFWYEWCVSVFTIFLQVVFFTRLISYMKVVAEHRVE